MDSMDSNLGCLTLWVFDPIIPLIPLVVSFRIARQKFDGYGYTALFGALVYLYNTGLKQAATCGWAQDESIHVETLAECQFLGPNAISPIHHLTTFRGLGRSPTTLSYSRRSALLLVQCVGDAAWRFTLSSAPGF